MTAVFSVFHLFGSNSPPEACQTQLCHFGEEGVRGRPHHVGEEGKGTDSSLDSSCLLSASVYRGLSPNGVLDSSETGQLSPPFPILKHPAVQAQPRPAWSWSRKVQ